MQKYRTLITYNHYLTKKTTSKLNARIFCSRNTAHETGCVLIHKFWTKRCVWSNEHDCRKLFRYVSKFPSAEICLSMEDLQKRYITEKVKSESSQW